MDKLIYGMFKTGQLSVHLSESESINWLIYVQATFITSMTPGIFLFSV